MPTRAEVLTLLNAAPAKFRTAIALGIAVFRVGEVMAMFKDRIDINARRVRIDRQLQNLTGNVATLVTPKAAKVREIIVPGAVALELRRHLAQYCDESESGQLLFRYKTAGPFHETSSTLLRGLPH